MLLFFLAIILMLSLLASPKYIEWLRVNQYGQYIREEGPKSHFDKMGTPTMGAFIFIIPIVFISVLSIDLNREIVFLLTLFLIFMCVGFVDDFLKVFKKQNEGLTSLQKIILQISLSIVVYFLFLHKNIETDISLPFFNYEINLGIFYFIFFVLMVIASSNATNLTDGLDGLLTTTYLIPLFFYAYIAYSVSNIELFSFILVIIFSLFIFLVFNFYPAKIFMGDTGSLSLGALLAGIAITTKTEILLLFFGFVFVFETLSVIIQVFFFKKYKKRIFKMTPIHHHYELKGYNEKQIVFIFTLIQLFFSIVALTLYKIYF